MEGWVKLHRKILESDMYQQLNAKQKVVLFTLLLMANHKPRKWEWQGKIYELQPGQMITSLETIRKKCGKDVSVKTVRSALLKLEKWGFLANQSAKTGRLITIINWYSYQNETQETGKDIGKEGAKKGQSKGKAGATNKNDKNDKNEKKKKNIRTLSDDRVCSTPDEVELNPPPSSSPSPSSLVPFKRIFELWNETITEHESVLPRLVALNPNTARGKHVRARWKEYPDLEIWKITFERAAQSSFLNGDNDRGFQGTFDWIVKSNTNFTKVLEGNYNDSDNNQKSIKWKDLIEFNDANPEAVAKNIKAGNMDETTVPPDVLIEARKILKREKQTQEEQSQKSHGTSQDPNKPPSPKTNSRSKTLPFPQSPQEKQLKQEKKQQDETVDLFKELLAPMCTQKRRALKQTYGPYIREKRIVRAYG